VARLERDWSCASGSHRRPAFRRAPDAGVEQIRRDRCETHRLVTPYLDDVQARINANYEKDDTSSCRSEPAMQDNFSFSTVTEDQIRAMTKEVAAAKPDAIAIVCTNMRGAPLAEELEASTASRSYDTIFTTEWEACGPRAWIPAR